MTKHTIRVARLLLPVLCLLLCAAADAYACSCVGPGSACSAVKRADAVFVGRVTSLDGGSLEVEVERAVFGVQPGRISISNGPGNCGLNFRQGERYVVYAHRHPSSGALFTNMCTRTRPLSDPHTRADLAHFDRLQKNGPSGNVVTGVVFDATADLANRTPSWRPISGAVVTASLVSGGPARTTITRADGTYEFTAMPAGSLRIMAAIPAEFEVHEPILVMLREPNGCAEADIPVRIDGRVRGQLLDERGRPIRGVDVQLADAATARSQPPYLPALTTKTGQDGMFEFRHVGPGRYVIGVELQRPVRAGKLDRRRFYGETHDPASATEVRVGEAQKVDLAPFKLKPLPSDRIVTVIVQPAGDVAAATRLFLTGATREPLEHGGTPVTLRLPFGAGYVIEAEPPEGHRVAQRAVRIERDDTDHTVEFRVERQ